MKLISFLNTFQHEVVFLPGSKKASIKMFGKLKNKWKLSSLQLLLVFVTFALGGSSCSWLSKKIIFSFSYQHSILSWIGYFICVCLLWPLCVLVISIPLGQFTFFKNYVGKILKRFRS
jgi:hypothetical protein